MEVFVDVAVADEVSVVDEAVVVAEAEADVLDLEPGFISASSATIYGGLTCDRRADTASCQ